MTTIARIDVQPWKGAAAAPDADTPDAPVPATPAGSRLPALAMLAGGSSLAFTSLLGRGASPLLRLGGGLAGIGVAIGGAMMLAMSDPSQDRGATEPTQHDSTAPGSSAPAGPERPLAFNQERRDGPTPSGGAYSIASYFDADGNAVQKADAVNVSIVEYAADGAQIAETSGTIRR